MDEIKKVTTEVPVYDTVQVGTKPKDSWMTSDGKMFDQKWMAMEHQEELNKRELSKNLESNSISFSTIIPSSCDWYYLNSIQDVFALFDGNLSCRIYDIHIYDEDGNYSKMEYSAILNELSIIPGWYATSYSNGGDYGDNLYLIARETFVDELEKLKSKIPS